MKKYLRAMFRLISMLSISLTSAAWAAPAPAIYQFDVLAVTSAIYNPVLPNPLTTYSVLTMNWDVIYGPYQFKQSDLPHSGDWLAFVTETYGYRVDYYPPATYTNGNVTFFGTYDLVDSSGILYGYFDEYACVSCAPKGSFRATTTSINTGQVWTAYMYVN